MQNIKSSLILLFLFALLLSASSKAQTDDIVIEEKKNYLDKDRWAFIFEVGTYINSKAFESYSLSSKYHLSDNFALRIGLGFNYSKSEGTENIIDEGFNKQYPSDSKDLDLVSYFNFVFYPISKSEVVMFIGAGPVYQYDEYKSTNINVYYIGSGYSESIRHSERKTWKAGVNVVLGAEWFIFKQFSLLGEYNMSALFGKGDTYSKSTSFSPTSGTMESEHKTEEDVTEYKFNIVRIGVSLYL